MTRYVSLAVDAHPHYVRWLPLACLAWELQGVDPLVTLIGDSPLMRAARDWLITNTRARCRALFAPVSYGSLSSANSARVIRLAAPQLFDLADDDLVITSDVESIPLVPFDPPSALPTIYRADAYADLSPAHPPARVPMCWIEMRADEWQDLTGRLPFELAPYDPDSADEHFITSRLFAASPLDRPWELAPLRARWNGLRCWLASSTYVLVADPYREQSRMRSWSVPPLELAYHVPRPEPVDAFERALPGLPEAAAREWWALASRY